MNLYDVIVNEYPDLTIKDFWPIKGKIALVDDGDGIQYIAKWEHSEPLPDGLTLGKPE